MFLVINEFNLLRTFVRTFVIIMAYWSVCKSKIIFIYTCHKEFFIQVIARWILEGNLFRIGIWRIIYFDYSFSRGISLLILLIFIVLYFNDFIFNIFFLFRSVFFFRGILLVVRGLGALFLFWIIFKILS